MAQWLVGTQFSQGLRESNKGVWQKFLFEHCFLLYLYVIEPRLTVKHLNECMWLQTGQQVNVGSDKRDKFMRSTARNEQPSVNISSGLGPSCSLHGNVIPVGTLRTHTELLPH